MSQNLSTPFGSKFDLVGVTISSHMHFPTAAMDILPPFISGPNTYMIHPQPPLHLTTINDNNNNNTLLNKTNAGKLFFFFFFFGTDIDERHYELLSLPNINLDILLVSDPTTDKAAAAMDVHVGHISDPEETPGLAHFCEHLLFMGSDKYPEENEYSQVGVFKVYQGDRGREIERSKEAG
jgi:hypothetical protein